MPDEQHLPPGPRRDLVVALHDLYACAGKPAARTISAWIRDQDDLPGTLSHEGVSAVLRGTGTPRWANLESLVRVLVQQQRVGKADIDIVVRRIHVLWCFVDGGPPPANESSSTPPTVPESERSEDSASENQNPHSGTRHDESGESGPRTSLQGSLIRWEHPRLGVLDFRDRQTAVEIFREVGGFNDQP